MIDVVQAIIASRPNDVVWGSNWPHGGVAVPMPNDGDLLDFVLAVAPDENPKANLGGQSSGTLRLVARR